jgi:hypothetical protein
MVNLDGATDRACDKRFRVYELQLSCGSHLYVRIAFTGLWRLQRVAK